MQPDVTCEQCQDLMISALDAAPDALQARKVDAHLQHCSECQDLKQTLWETSALATRWADEPVPRWPRRRAFFDSPRLLPPLQWVSAFASLVVLVLVLGEARISTAEGFAIHFGPADYLTQEAFNQALADAQASQQEMLELKVNDLASQQAATNQLLMRTVLEMSREERREDFGQLVSAWDDLQSRRSEQTDLSIRALLASQVEDKRNIEQLNRLLRQASLEGNDL